MTYKYWLWDSPVGWLGLGMSGKGISFLLYVKNEKDFLSKIPKSVTGNWVKSEQVLTPVVDELKQYFSGNLRQFKTPIDLLNGTEFQKTIWNMLLQIPYGQVRTYQWFADKLKLQNGARAVGTANGSNPVSIIIPCHRVINTNGKLGGYGGGLDVKRRLLELEGSLQELPL